MAKYKIDGTVLLQKRHICNLTQAQVAAAVGITEKTYRDIEKNIHTPRSDTLSRICELLAISPADIYIFDHSEIDNLQKLKKHVDHELHLSAQMLAQLLKVRYKAYDQVDGYSILNTVFVEKNHLEVLLLKEPFTIAQICTTIMNFVANNCQTYHIYRSYAHYPIQEIGNLLQFRHNQIKLIDHPDISREIGILLQFLYELTLPNERDQSRLNQLIDDIEIIQSSDLSDNNAASSTMLTLYFFLSNRWNKYKNNMNYYYALSMICILLENPIIDKDDLLSYNASLRAINQFLISLDQANLAMRH